jgi:MFS family permease
MPEPDVNPPSISSRSVMFQWAQLFALAFAHFVVDLFPGLLHSTLPAVQTHFKLNVTLGGILLTSYLLVSNGIQLLTGHLRENKTRPLFIYIGLVFGSVLCFLSALPAAASSFPVILGFTVVSAAGVGIIHPECLRGIHTLNKIPPAVSTSVFMAGGILGFAFGGYTSTALITKFSMPGLYFFVLCSALAILLVALTKNTLAVESKTKNAIPASPEKVHPPFVLIMLMATFAAISTATIVWIMPQRLHELGFELTFGGFTVMLFSVAGGLGSFLWAFFAHKKGELPCAIFALFLGLPFFVAYDLLIQNRFAVWFVFAASFCCFGAYPLMVTIGRYSTGMTLGRRMGFIVGGTWLISSMFPAILAPLAKTIGMQTILACANIGYLFSALLGLYIQRKMRIKANIVSLQNAL